MVTCVVQLHNLTADVGLQRAASNSSYRLEALKALRCFYRHRLEDTSTKFQIQETIAESKRMRLQRYCPGIAGTGDRNIEPKIRLVGRACELPGSQVFARGQ